MGEIKTALELALERTKDVKSDPAAVQAAENRRRGMRLLSQLRENPEFDIHKEIKHVDRKSREQVRAGLLEVLLSSLSLPTSETSAGELDLIRRAFGQAAPRNRRAIEGYIDQLGGLLQRFFEDRTQLIEQLRKQFEPRMRQKEEELARRTGQRVRLDPATDPEFAAVLNQNLQHLRGQYEEVLGQVKTELESLYLDG